MRDWNPNRKGAVAELAIRLAAERAGIGVYLPRVQSNFFVGIRTPWTLSSEVAWHKTHAVGGPACVLLGLAMMATAFFPTGMTAVLIVGTLGVALGLSVYSYFAWRSDPDKHMV